MAKTKAAETSSGQSTSTSELAQALITAIESTKPPAKMTIRNRRVNSPWVPKDGSPKLKMRRKYYQHGLLINPDRTTNERIELLNQLKPGTFLNGYVKVVKRRDKGIDIDYAIKTHAQQRRLSNDFGISSLDDLLRRCIAESLIPKRDDGYDLDEA